METIGERIRAARLANNLTIPEVSAKTGISKGNLSSIENNKNKPSADALVSLSELFGVTSDWILKGDSPDVIRENSTDTYQPAQNDKSKIVNFLNLILDTWEKADEDTRGWIIVQLKRAFPELAEKAEGYNSKQAEDLHRRQTST